MADNRNIRPEDYTDKNMQVVTQLAYIDFNSAMYGKTIGEILNNSDDYNEIYNQFIGKYGNPEKGSLTETRMQESIALLETLKNDPIYSSWKIVDVRDENDGNGFYAVTIETDANSAVIGFRGSESIDPEHFFDDWIMADVGLLNSTMTAQQASATEYMAYINQNFNYLDYVSSGHSLGGNLAAHSVLTAPDSMNVVSGYSFDGPGNSDEYLRLHDDEIIGRGYKINHYQWTIIGGLLNQIKNENYKYIDTSADDFNYFVGKHDTSFVEFQDGKWVKPCEKDEAVDYVQSTIDEFTASIDNIGVAMNGEGGNDTLNGGNGDDILEGGTGNDFLYGNSGNDTYVFSKGSVSDTIEDWNGSSLVKLTDINIDEISISKMNDSTLVLTIDSTGDTLTVNGYKWNQGGYTFEFADGTTDSINKDTWKWESGFGSTAGEDTPPEQNIMTGTSGNDNIYGTDGSDIIDGSTGNDTLCGGNGEDTYIFAKGYEADTINEWGSDHSIIQLADINSDEVTITDQWGSNLILTVNGTNDTLTISNFKWGQSSYTFEFADGAVATVNKDTWALEFSKLPDIPEVSEDEITQSNAELLSDIYADDNLSSDLLTEADSTVISDVSDSVSVANENEEIANQTDIQVMILTENMSAFSNEDNISENTNITDITDTSVMNQLLVGSQVQ